MKKMDFKKLGIAGSRNHCLNRLFSAISKRWIVILFFDMYNSAVIESKRSIYACDIGSTLNQKKRGTTFGWVRLNPSEGIKSIQGSSDIQELVEQLRLDIDLGYSVSLGFESPLFIPVPDNSRDLSKGREGDGDRSWSAPSGAYVTTLGIHQSAWILKRLHESSSGKCEFTLDSQRWSTPSHQHILFCWEAFVSGAAHSKILGNIASAVIHSEQHQRDAATAAVFFYCNESNLQKVNAVKIENCISLIGAVALWSGWTYDLAYLRKTALVLKPNSVFEGKFK